MDRLVDEVESLGRSDLRACESQVDNLLVHFLKAEFGGDARAQNHWKREVLAFQIGYRRKRTPTIQRMVREALPDLYEDAVRLTLVEQGLDPKHDRARLPADCPYTFDQVIGEPDFWFPEPPA